MTNAEAKLEVALKWLDKIASFAGQRQRSATETEDYYLKGVHDADTAARKLVELAKEEIARTTIGDDEWLNQRYQVYVPGADDQYHVADDNGGTLCGEKFGDGWRDRICDKCETIKEQLTSQNPG